MDTSFFPLNIVTPSGTKTRTFAPQNASLADLRELLITDKIILPRAKFQVDGIVIGTTAEVHTKWTDIVREIHICNADDQRDGNNPPVATRNTACSDNNNNSNQAAYPNPFHSPKRDTSSGKPSSGLPTEPSNERPGNFQTHTARVDQEDARGKSGRATELDNHSTLMLPETVRPGDSQIYLPPTGQEEARDEFGRVGELDDCSTPMLPNAVPSQDDDSPDCCLDSRTRPKDAPEKWLPYLNTGTENRPTSEKQYDDDCLDNGKIGDSDESLPDCSSKQASTTECYPPPCKDEDNCGRQAKDEKCKEQSGCDAPVNGAVESDNSYKPRFRPLRLSRDGPFTRSDVNRGSKRSPFSPSGRFSMPDGSSEQCSPPGLRSAVMPNFDQTDLNTRQFGQLPESDMATPRGSGGIADLKGLAKAGGDAQVITRGARGPIESTDMKGQFFLGDLAQPRFDATFGGPNPSLTASLNAGPIIQAEVNVPLASDTAPKALGGESWKHQLDLVNTVKTVMQAGCADRTRFAAAFGGLEVSSDLFHGTQDKISEAPFTKPLGMSASLTVNGDKSQQFVGTIGSEGSIVSGRCRTPSIFSNAESQTGAPQSDTEGSVTSECPTDFAQGGLLSQGPETVLAKVPLYRLFSPATSDHFYTTNAAERDACVSYGYNLESTAAQILASPSGSGESIIPFFRIYRNKEHFYTTDVAEKERTVREGGARDEGIVGYVYATRQNGTIPLYRLYNPGLDDHFYTTSAPEKEVCLKMGFWNDEGVACYVYP